MVSANCAVYRFFTAYVIIRTVPQSGAVVEHPSAKVP